MVITKNQLDKLLQEQSAIIPQEVYDDLLETYSKEPEEGYEWTEQDIYMQMRKIILPYL